MRVAGLQLDIAWEDPAENFRRAQPLAREAARAGARLLALPEMFATGFSMRAEEMAAHAPATRAFLADTAERLGLWVIGGFAEPGENRPVNACSVFAPDGKRIGTFNSVWRRGPDGSWQVVFDRGCPDCECPPSSDPPN